MLFVLVDGWALMVGAWRRVTEGRLMDFDGGIEHLRLAYWTILVTAGPALGVALLAGLVVGVVQAATSINETDTQLRAEAGVVLGTLALASGFMLTAMTDFFAAIIDTIRTIR